MSHVYTVAILAMGGEGGGVLADWLVHLAEHAGYEAQTTSVPGVAQRTGATIYYVEFVQTDPAQRVPVLSLMPVPGEVDIVIASELMEAGRAIQRGLVTNDRSTLVTSIHRVYSMTEKIAMSDGRVDSEKLLSLCASQARHLVAHDFSALAEAQGSVISAALFGAVAATGVLPFTKAQFEQAVELSGVGVKPSLAAFNAAYALTLAAPPEQFGATADARRLHSPKPWKLGPKLEVLGVRLSTFPSIAQATLAAGVTKLVDYQDMAYAEAYLSKLDAFWSKAQPNGPLLEETARGLALWMAYEDVVRVADLKTRKSRFERVANEVRLQEKQVLEIREYLHPRVEEIADSLPKGLGEFVLSSGFMRALMRPFLGRGRILETSSMHGFVLMYLLAGCRVWRKSSLRFQEEQVQINVWLGHIESLASQAPALALELARTQRLMKGYSDTQQRGKRNFQTMLRLLPRLKTSADGASRLKSLVDAALADDQGHALKATIQRFGFELA